MEHAFNTYNIKTINEKYCTKLRTYVHQYIMYSTQIKR